MSGNEWESYIEENRVLVNGKKAGAGHILVQGDRIETIFPVLPEPPIDKRFEILYEDEALIAVCKPGNLPCHPGGKYFRHTLWHLLRKDGIRNGLHFVHRLDQIGRAHV